MNHVQFYTETKIEEKNIVKEIWLTQNIDSSPIEFTLSPRANMGDGSKTSEELNLEIIGIFHSHPKGEARPSNTDKKFMVNQPRRICLDYLFRN